jgi:hypothetical protein
MYGFVGSFKNVLCLIWTSFNIMHNGTI